MAEVAYDPAKAQEASWLASFDYHAEQEQIARFKGDQPEADRHHEACVFLLLILNPKKAES